MRFLLVQQRQFGYLKDTYEWVNYFVKNGHEVHVVSFDNGLKKLELLGVDVDYIEFSKGNRWKNYIRLLGRLRYLESQGSYDWLIIEYFIGCSLFRFIAKTVNIHLDIRTGSVRLNKITRNLENSLISFESRVFENISVIDDIIGQMLLLKSAQVVPLGADRYSRGDKSFKELSLLYVGTLNNRRIVDTVKGFCNYVNKYNLDWETSPVYHIVGDGYGEELEEIYELVDDSNCTANVFIHGRKDGDELLRFWNICNVGVSYIPKGLGFDDQVPTKTLEYLKNGMFCLATSTNANKSILSECKSKILFEDNPRDFERALVDLKKLYDNGLEVEYTYVAGWDEVSSILLDYVKKNS